MSLLYTIYIVAICCVILFLALDHSHATSRYHTLYRKYTSLIVAAAFSEEDCAGQSTPRSTITTSVRHRNILSEAVHNIMSHTYGCDNSALRHIITTNHLPEYLLGQLATASTLRRCRLLSQLASYITPSTDISALQRYLKSNNHFIRTSALIALLSASPSGTMQILSSLHFQLQPLDIQRIIALVRRGRISVVLEPLLENHDRNLQLLGMALVRSFGIGIVDKHLYRICQGQDSELTQSAIYTLTHLKRPLRHKIIRECVATMSEQQRKRLCRHLSVEGYSMQSINAILSPTECLYAKRLITSYKRQLSHTHSRQYASR